MKEWLQDMQKPFSKFSFICRYGWQIVVVGDIQLNQSLQLYHSFHHEIRTVPPSCDILDSQQ
jgi:hypothetical protein